MGNQSKADRPRIRPEKEPIDFLLEYAGLFGLVVLLVLTAMKYKDLPDTIPTHFNAAGRPDGFGPKIMIWLLPVITVVIYTGLSILNRFPYIFNFPVNITGENALRLYRFATRSIRVLNFLLTITFLYLTWESINAASGKSPGLGAWFLPVMVVVIMGFLIYMIVRMYKLK